MSRFTVKRNSLSDRIDFDYFAAIIIATRATYVMRTFDLAAVCAFGLSRCTKGVMRPAHVSAGFGYFLLRNSHSYLSLILKRVYLPSILEVSIAEARYIKQIKWFGKPNARYLCVAKIEIWHSFT